MSDRDLNASDYQQFINSKGARPRCPLCQHEEWSLINETDGQSYGLPKTSRTAPSIGDIHSAPMLLLSCKNCGFTATILREKVLKDLGG